MKIRHALISFILILASAYYCIAAEITNVRYWAAPDHTRLVFDIASEPSFEVQEGKNFLLLSFKDCLCKSALPAEILVNKPGVKKVLIHSKSKGSVVKVEIILDKYSKTQVFKLKKFQDKPDRVVVDVFLEEIPLKELIRETSSKSKKKKIIVIDPGHGGDDPGAVGKKGTYEKNVVLAIGREMKKAVNKIPGYRAVLTRDGDYYVSFNKRLQIAKDLRASLFISVHADAALNRQARGSSVYCLSTGAASSEAAKLLAKNENLSDIIGGVPNGEGKADSDQIILNMFQTNTINFSKTYAGNLMRELNKVNCLKYESVQEAPFRVLKLPDIPAVLIETAYISNEEEERLLKSDNFRKNLALAVVSSATEYLSSSASIAQAGEIAEDSVNTVSSGEKNSTEKINGVKKASRTYIVKRGDTLFSLAKNNSMTIDELRKLNHIKSSRPLLLGQKIRLP
jgi:N-acetylmuramoyl-L-alanine amidase